MRNIDKELPEYVIDHGFISKQDPSGVKKLNVLYASSHFLFVPSLAEAYGLVFCEASAFGLPSISHVTGGLTTIIKNDINGKLFEIGTPAIVFADYINKMFEQYDKYVELSKSSYSRFEK